ncbi:MAG: right-handed parallel beta-helix repeat-containing protein [Planctomycetaceae bacterium]|nr:right-handed parallel beta-helix repeat-containing protein [Planctomycetaceae bacterium]
MRQVQSREFLISAAVCLIGWVGVVKQTFAQPVRTTPLVLSEGGTPDQPVVFDGQGLVIDLGTDISEYDWDRRGELWMSRGPLAGLPPLEDVQRAGLFLDDHPLRIVRRRGRAGVPQESAAVQYVPPQELPPGQMGWSDDGSVYFRWPSGLTPGAAKVIQPPPNLQSCVVIACSHLTVRNVVARHAANDGFNIHGDRIGIRLENVKAIANGDEGISAHETVQMDVVNAEIAWNGSTAGGVADVGESVTTYRNCELHHNLGAAFYFDGLRHTVTDCLIHHQDRDIVRRGDDAVVESSGVEWRR